MELPGISRKILGMCYRVKNSTSTFTRTDPSITPRVPFVERKHVNLCSDATAAMIVQAWGFKLDSSEMKNKRGVVKGASIEDHTDIAVEGACKWCRTIPARDLSAAYIIDYLFECGPLGAGMSTGAGGHRVAIIGACANDDEVILHDPWSGPFKMRKFKDFERKVSEIVWLDQVGAEKMKDASSPWMS